MERNQRIVNLCHNRLIFNLQDFLLNNDDDHKFKSFDNTDKSILIDELQKNYNDVHDDDIPEDKEIEHLPSILKKLKITFSGVYEIISEESNIKNNFFDCVINQALPQKNIFLFSNRLNLTSYPKKNVNIFLVTSYLELHIYLNILYNHLKDNCIEQSIIIINDFSSICYELDVLPTHFKITVELVAICRRIVDLTGAVILCGSIPRKSGNIQHLNIGGLMPSPWRNVPFYYVYLTKNNSQVIAKLENTFENTLEIIDLTELNKF